MTFVTDIRHSQLGLLRWIREANENRRREAARRRLYNTAYNELNALSQRELDDIGISRDSIPEIAHEAAYGK